MKTRILEKNEINDASKIIENNGIVALPTETVYGLFANAVNECAVKKVFEVKKRPFDNPLAAHVIDFDYAFFIAHFNETAKELARKFWPGPLTLVLKSKNFLPKIVTNSSETIAVRMPNHSVVFRVMKKTPITVAPSANISGKPSSTNFQHVLNDFDEKIDAVMKSSSNDIGIESTIIDLNYKTPRILRPGFILKEEIEKVLEMSVEECYDNFLKKEEYRHYSPRTKLIILESDLEDEEYEEEFSNYLQFKEDKVGLLIFQEQSQYLKNVYNKFKIFVLGSVDCPLQVSKNLFSILRNIDEFNLEKVYVSRVKNCGLWRGIRDRIYKASRDILILKGK